MRKTSIMAIAAGCLLVLAVVLWPGTMLTVGKWLLHIPFIWLLSALISIGGIYLALMGLASPVICLTSLGFKPTRGRVVEVEMRGSAPSDDLDVSAPEISYVYEVNGRVYRSSKLAVMPPLFTGTWGQKRAARLLKRHPPGSEVTVYYNPSDPSEAVLRRGLNLTVLVMLVCASGFGFFLFAAGANLFKWSACTLGMDWACGDPWFFGVWE